MYDYEFIFCNELHEKLKEKIKGKIWTKAYHDELHVKIETKECGSDYEYIIEGLSLKILYGLNSEYVSYEIFLDYRNYINNIFFK